MLEVINNTSISLNTNDTIPFTTVSLDTNADAYFDSATNSIVITKSGYFCINGSFVFTPSSSELATITMYINNVATQTFSSITATEAQTYTFTINDKLLRTIPTTNGSDVNIKFVTNVGGTLVNARMSEFRLK